MEDNDVFIPCVYAITADGLVWHTGGMVSATTVLI